MSGSIKYSYATAQEERITQYLAEGNRAAAENVYNKNLKGKVGRHGGQGVAASQARMESLLYQPTAQVSPSTTPQVTFNYTPAPPWPYYDWSPPDIDPYVPPTESLPYTTVKIENTNIINWKNPQVSSNFIEELYFQDIGGTEILRVARHDTINGENIKWQPIGNVDELANEFNPQNILTNTTMSGMLNFYALDIENNISNLGDALTFDNTKQELVIQLDDIKPDQYVQVMITKDGAELLGTNRASEQSLRQIFGWVDENDY
jgi:hypothetical protein